jgi:hypothetical protein
VFNLNPESHIHAAEVAGAVLFISSKTDGVVTQVFDLGPGAKIG